MQESKTAALIKGKSNLLGRNANGEVGGGAGQEGRRKVGGGGKTANGKNKFAFTTGKSEGAGWERQKFKTEKRCVGGH